MDSDERADEARLLGVQHKALSAEQEFLPSPWFPESRMHNERCTSGSEGGRQKPAAATSHGADARPLPYIPMARGFLYLVAVMDWVSRYVLAWRLSNLLDASFCIEALEDALSQGRPEIFNTDQGSQFTDDDFTGVLRAHGVAISMDGRGRFADNIFVERLWRSLKYEEVYLKAYESVAEARQGIAAYFEFYNHQRLHQALAYRTPRQVFDEAPRLASSARRENAGACPTLSAQ